MPKIVDHDVRREHVMDAAMTLIARVGLDGATMRAISDEAGCSTGLVTHYFVNRDELIVGVLRHVHHRSTKRMSRRLEGHDPAADVLTQVVLEALPLDKARTIEWKVWLSFWGAAVGDEGLVAEHRQRYKEWRALVHQLVTGAVADGTFRPDIAVQSETDRIVALVDGLGIQATLESSRLRPRRVRALVADHIASLH